MSHRPRQGVIRPAWSRQIASVSVCPPTVTVRAAMQGDDGEQTPWLTYAELGALRGIDRQSARRLASRRKWGRQRDNRGTVRVCVPIEQAESRRRYQDISTDTPADMTAAKSANTPAVMSADISVIIAPLEDAVATLREQLTAANSRAEAR